MLFIAGNRYRLIISPFSSFFRFPLALQSGPVNINICNAIIGLKVLILAAVGLQIRLSGKKTSSFFLFSLTYFVTLQKIYENNSKTTYHNIR